MSTQPTSYLPYCESSVATILILTSFLLTLNVINHLFDQLIFCGLLGQVFVGVAWGTPGLKWLGRDTEDVVVQLGYLGLLLLVYEGGLSTNFRSLKANLLLSIGVAITGIAFPIALSFVLLSLMDATPLQAFAAGAALCSTSLGTTFTILTTSGLSETRVGTVLTSAAMMDDVVGLVMVQVISNLGESASAFNPVTVVRPVVVSLGFAIAVPVFCRFVVGPGTIYLSSHRQSKLGRLFEEVCQATHFALIVHTLILLGFVAGASYAKTSNLFGAYIAGASISWWESKLPNSPLKSPSPHANVQPSATRVEGEMLAFDHDTITVIRNSTLEQAVPIRDNAGSHLDVERESKSSRTSTQQLQECRTGSGSRVYEKYYAASVQRVLKPFFFASIGFAIPITEMFHRRILWRGLVYTALMFFGKLVTGAWLVRLNLPSRKVFIPKVLHALIPPSCLHTMRKSSNDNAIDLLQLQVKPAPKVSGAENVATPPVTGNPPHTPAKRFDRPLSLYPATMLGTAMTARGEIGFLIASLAESNSLFATPDPDQMLHEGSSDIYLVVVWAIVLCTIAGPLGIGLLGKRVRTLQAERKRTPMRVDPLGVWAVR